MKKISEHFKYVMSDSVLRKVEAVAVGQTTPYVLEAHFGVERASHRRQVRIESVYPG